jgi:hypothetical protein
MKNMKETGSVRIFGYTVTCTVITHSSCVKTRIEEISGKTPCENGRSRFESFRTGRTGPYLGWKEGSEQNN